MIRRTNCLAAAALHVAAVVLLQACSERHEMLYDSIADASKAGEVKRGWIPDFLPISSRRIRIVYAAESTSTWCEFQFAPDDSGRFREHLKTVDRLPEAVRHVENPGLSWWPDSLRGDLDVERLRLHGFDVCLVTEPDVEQSRRVVVFVVDWRKGRAFFYRTTGG